MYRALNLNTGQMVAVKRIRLEGLKEDEIAQLMKEVDLVKSLSHPSIVKYEGMARDDDTLSIVLEYVFFLPGGPGRDFSYVFALQVRGERFLRTDTEGVREAERAARGELRRQDSGRAALSPSE